MKLAKLSELKEIYGHFQKYKEVFPHLRQDALRRRIKAKQCIYENGVVITFQTYKKKTWVGDVLIPAGATMLHQIVNSEQGNGTASTVFNHFCDEVFDNAKGDLYLTVRRDNELACKFYEKMGMRVAGKIKWSKGKIPGVVYRMDMRFVRFPNLLLIGCPDCPAWYSKKHVGRQGLLNHKRVSHSGSSENPQSV
jgi:RimJ/RimL family protein N-acetyltransferase